MAANLDLTGWLGSKERPADINLNSDLQWLQVFTCILPLPAYRPGRFWAQIQVLWRCTYMDADRFLLLDLFSAIYMFVCICYHARGEGPLNEISHCRTLSVKDEDDDDEISGFSMRSNGTSGALLTVARAR